MCREILCTVAATGQPAAVAGRTPPLLWASDGNTPFIPLLFLATRTLFLLHRKVIFDFDVDLIAVMTMTLLV